MKWHSMVSLFQFSSKWETTYVGGKNSKQHKQTITKYLNSIVHTSCALLEGISRYWKEAGKSVDAGVAKTVSIWALGRSCNMDSC